MSTMHTDGGLIFREQALGEALKGSELTESWHSRIIIRVSHGKLGHHDSNLLHLIFAL